AHDLRRARLRRRLAAGRGARTQVLLPSICRSHAILHRSIDILIYYSLVFAKVGTRLATTKNEAIFGCAARASLSRIARTRYAAPSRQVAAARSGHPRHRAPAL